MVLLLLHAWMSLNDFSETSLRKHVVLIFKDTESIRSRFARFHERYFHMALLSNKSLEPVCCKKQQKKVPDQLLVRGIRDLDSEWYKIDPG